MPQLDRLIEFDERSRNYPIRTLIADKVRRSYTWRVQKSLNQGDLGACVGFAWTHEAIARPKEHLELDNPDAFQRYYRAQQLDEWPGEAYEGTSVLAGAKAQQEAGLIGEYRWAFGEEDLALAVGFRGPVILGTWWWTGMDTPYVDAQGRQWITPTGTKRGGHALLVNGYSVPLNAYKLWNSWGAPSSLCIHKDHMALLLADEGEACVPTQRL